MNKTTTTDLDKRILWGWIAIIILAAVVYTVGISHESFWYDEAYSSVIASYLPWQIPAQVMVDNHPPLYYILLSLVRMALGNSEWALRSLSVAGAVGLVALGAGPVRRIFGNRNAFLYAIVVLFTPAILIYAHEARMYSLAICAVTAGALYGYLAVTENRSARLGPVRRGDIGRSLPALLWTHRSLFPACVCFFLAFDQTARAVKNVSDRRSGRCRCVSSLADRLHPADAERT